MVNERGPGDAPAIVHDRAAREFRWDLGGATAVLNYELSPGTIDFTHTGVPDAFRNRGIGGQMARAGLEFADAEGLAVVASCSFVAEYIRNHPEYRRLLRRG